jgi:DNA polymerase III delta prime subunit
MLNLDLVGQAASALAKLQTPAFPHVDDEFVYEVFSRAFNKVRSSNEPSLP